MVFEFSIGLICLTTGVIFLWLWRKISKNEYLEIEALDYLYVSLICLGAAIYAGAFTPLFGNIAQSKIHLYQQITVFGILTMIAFFMHFLSRYDQKPWVARVVDLFCFVLLLMCVFEFRFYRGIDSLVTYNFIITNLSVTLHQPDIGYKALATLVFLIIVYSTWIFGTAYFKRKHKHVGYCFVGSFTVATLGLHDVMWALRIIELPLYHLFEFGMLAFIFGMAIKLLLEFSDAFSIQESHIGRLQTEIASLLQVSKDALKGDETHDNFLKELFDILEKKIGDPELTVARLAKDMYMTTESLRRKLKELTGLSTQTFLCHIRVGLAALYLKKTTNSITWIALEAGFNSSSYFGKCFQEFYGKTPSQYRQEAGAYSSHQEVWISEFGRRFSAPKS